MQSTKQAVLRCSAHMRWSAAVQSICEGWAVGSWAIHHVSTDALTRTAYRRAESGKDVGEGRRGGGLLAVNNAEKQHF